MVTAPINKATIEPNTMNGNKACFRSSLLSIGRKKIYNALNDNNQQIGCVRPAISTALITGVSDDSNNIQLKTTDLRCRAILI